MIFPLRLYTFIHSPIYSRLKQYGCFPWYLFYQGLAIPAFKYKQVNWKWKSKCCNKDIRFIKVQLFLLCKEDSSVPLPSLVTLRLLLSFLVQSEQLGKIKWDQISSLAPPRLYWLDWSLQPYYQSFSIINITFFLDTGPLGTFFWGKSLINTFELVAANENKVAVKYFQSKVKDLFYRLTSSSSIKSKKVKQINSLSKKENLKT